MEPLDKVGGFNFHVARMWRIRQADGALWMWFDPCTELPGTAQLEVHGVSVPATPLPTYPLPESAVEMLDLFRVDDSIES